MVQAEVTPIDHRCVTFRSSAEFLSNFFVLKLCVLHQQLFVQTYAK